MSPDDREVVLLDVRPHGRALTGPVVALLVTAGAAGLLAARAGAGPHPGALRLAVAAAAVVLLVPLSLRPWLRWLGTRLVLTDRRLTLWRGLLRRSSRKVALVRVHELEVRQGPAERLQGCGTLVVFAGGAEPLAVAGLGAVRAVRDEVDRATRAAARR